MQVPEVNLTIVNINDSKEADPEAAYTEEPSSYLFTREQDRATQR